ncbi:hypothetical protein BDN70DRAFT_939453 [Pholiota conissans]|uniref:Uncharacterized protein n=1 Tax=Pholiota conissans TaxID=109636 RepID=A0A9P6CL57_9AGAR|nr:hypothetical protein BDN70DRAFT_939453 [Pholiota conissans]
MDRSGLSFCQLEQKLDDAETKLSKERFSHLDTDKALRRVRIHKQTYEDFIALARSQDIPGLHRIFKISNQYGWSAEKLMEKTQKALDGVYHPKSFSDLEFDLATTIYELGGSAALYALQKSPLSPPARTTLISRRQDYKLRMTVGSVTMTDILANIKTMFKDVKPGKAGMTLSMDEVASDGRLCYLVDSDEIGGLREHSGKELPSVKMGKNLDVVRAVTRAIRDGKIHTGQEVFVAAVARNDDADCGAKPVLLIPTC